MKKKKISLSKIAKLYYSDYQEDRELGLELLLAHYSRELWKEIQPYAYGTAIMFYYLPGDIGLEMLGYANRLDKASKIYYIIILDEEFYTRLKQKVEGL